jgi:Acyl-CoA reductase (LuxC)
MQTLSEHLAAFFKRSFPLLNPFEDLIVDFCDDLSKTFFHHPQIKEFPDISALAFWLRRGHIEALKDRFMAEAGPDGLLRPRGIVFHIPPKNVETLFVYSWMLSLLVGNANIVRLPKKENKTYETLLECIKKVMEEEKYLLIDQSTALISYGHVDEVTGWISGFADVRVLWGGDQTVEGLRKLPLKLNAKELVFVDRFSFAAINAQTYLKSSEEKKQHLTERFYRDVFWYDQRACSSPRMVVWVHSSLKGEEAAHNFYERLEKTIQKKEFSLPLGAILEKKTNIYSQALELPISSVVSYGSLTVIKLPHFDRRCREGGGLGTLYDLQVEALSDIVTFVSQKDQTLVYDGFNREELVSLVNQLNGRGLDRLVPIGEALKFEDRWDGYDMLLELTKRVQLETT